MKRVEGLVISTIDGGDISPDGTALRLITTVPGDAEVVLSFPYEQLLNLIALAAKGRTDCKRQRGIEPNDDADLIATAKFELGIDRKSGMALVMFTLNNGAKLSFALPVPLPAQTLTRFSWATLALWRWTAFWRGCTPLRRSC